VRSERRVLGALVAFALFGCDANDPSCEERVARFRARLQAIPASASQVEFSPEIAPLEMEERNAID
jgi:hypothetical protein